MVILDSVGPNGKRLISIEVTYWRAIHCEIMTHRAFARNAASSRAIPFYKTGVATLDRINDIGGIPLGKGLDGSELYDYVIPNCTYARKPYFPEFIGTEQKGMQSGDELSEPNRSQALALIEEMYYSNRAVCKRLADLGVHKSIVNRYLEPYSTITVLITATEWANFFRLRIHPAAEKHFNALATQIKAEIDASTPKQLRSGEWHMPYLLDEERNLDIETLKRVSSARCARLSYLTQDGRRAIDEDLRLFSRLLSEGDGIPHSSAFEHVAQACSDMPRSGPFIGWKQFRKEFANENVAG